jgi:hypothetical protein
MSIEFGLTNEATNTTYAPLAALWVHYQQNQTLKALERVTIPIKTKDFSPATKLQQILLSILAGCEYLSEVNIKLKPEQALARACHWERFTDQSNLSRSLDALTLMNIKQLRGAVTTIWHPHSQAIGHDWRGFLWLDFDLSGLPCGKEAQESQKGFFSGKKTRRVANWRGLARSNTVKRSGLTCLPVTNTRFVASNQPC